MRLTFLALVIVPAVALAQTTQPATGLDSTRITLKLKDISQQQLFDEIAKHTGATFNTIPANLWQRTPGNPISVEWDNKPFWLAIRDACGKAGLSLKHPLDSARPVILLSRDNQDWTAYPAVSSGPFLVNLIGLHRSATVDMRKPGEIQRQFYAKFSIFCEPRIRLLRGSLAANVESAVDDKDNKLASAKADNDGLAFVTSWVHSIEARLEYPKTPGTKIVTLRCSARFIAQIKSETIEIAEPLTSKNASKTVAGRKITLRELRRGAEEWEAVINFSRDGLSPEQWAAAIFPGNALKLIDNENREIKAHGFGLGTKGDEASYIFKFEKDSIRASRFSKPEKLVWEIPTETMDIPLDWEFRDLPMP